MLICAVAAFGPLLAEDANSCVAPRGFSLREFWDVRGFPFCGGKKGSETPSCGGKGLKLSRSLGRSMRNEGVSDPFPRRKRESQTLFPTAKGKLRTSPNPLSKNPLSATYQNHASFPCHMSQECPQTNSPEIRC